MKSFLHQETQEFSHQCLFSLDNGTMYKFCHEETHVADFVMFVDIVIIFSVFILSDVFFFRYI